MSSRTTTLRNVPGFWCLQARLEAARNKNALSDVLEATKQQQQVITLHRFGCRTFDDTLPLIYRVKGL